MLYHKESSVRRKKKKEERKQEILLLLLELNAWRNASNECTLTWRLLVPHLHFPSNSHHCLANFALGFAIFSLTLKIFCVPKFRSLRQVRHSLFIYYSSIFVCLSECVCGIFFFLFFKMIFSYSIYLLLIHLPATHFRVILKGLGNLRQWLLFLHRYLLRWTICFLFYIDILGSITLHR